MDPIAPLPEIAEDELTEEELSAREAQKLDVDLNTTIAAVSYIYILSVIVLFIRRDSRFAQFHARQGTVLFCLALIALVFPFWIRILAEFLLFLTMAFGFVQASQGRWVRIPGIASMLEGRGGDSHAARIANDGFVGVTGAVRRVIDRFQKKQGSPEEPPASQDQTPKT